MWCATNWDDTKFLVHYTKWKPNDKETEWNFYSMDANVDLKWTKCGMY